MKKYILFDLDGTVIDSKIGIAKSFQYALNKFDIKIDDINEICKLIGPPLKESFIKFYNFSEEDTLTAISYYRKYYADKALFEHIVYDGIEDLLISLKEQGKVMIIATSKPEIFAKKILDNFNLSKYFHFIGGSNLDNTRSKKADVISYVLDQCKIDNLSEVIMVGDREFDVYGAKALNLESIGILHGYGSYDELSNSGADYIVKNVAELKALLSTL